jgi:hypothetical protein
MSRVCSRNGEKRNAYRILVGKPKRKRPLGIPRLGGWTILRWILREIGWDGGDWIDVAQGWDQWRGLVNTVLNLRFP